MKIVMKKLTDDTKTKFRRVAGTLGSAFAAVAIVTAIFSQPMAEAVAICGVCVDYGAKALIRLL